MGFGFACLAVGRAIKTDGREFSGSSKAPRALVVVFANGLAHQ